MATPEPIQTSRTGRIVSRVVGFLACLLVVAGLFAELWLMLLQALFGGRQVDPRDIWDW